MRHSWIAIAFFVPLFWLGCRPDPVRRQDAVPIELDKSNERRLLEYYFSGYFEGEAQNPFDAGLIVESGSDFLLSNPKEHTDVTHHVTDLFASGKTAGSISWDLFESWVMDTWYEARGVPGTVQALRAAHGDWSDEQTWFMTNVTGSMSPFPRRIAVPVHQLRAAINQMESAESAILYPIGTVFIGEHLQGDRVVETTVMAKRSDGNWDFTAYGEDGQLITQITKEPDPLNVPTNCLGCHFGSRQFEPEESFPGDAPPGPNGPRAIRVGDEYRNADITRMLQEHARRSDTVLGLYGTLYLSERAHQHANGSISSEDSLLLEQLGL